MRQSLIKILRGNSVLIYLLASFLTSSSCILDPDNHQEENNLNSIPKSIDTLFLLPNGPFIELVFIPYSYGGFYIGKYEITNEQYKVFIDDTRYDGSDHPSSKSTEPFLNHFKNGNYPAKKGDYPICYVNWWHTKAYCNWLSRKTGKTVRLPTKDEWEYVAGGLEKRIYPWGNEWDPKRCNWASSIDGYEEAAPVGSFSNGTTPEGIHDLAGNIWEWCEDRVLRGGPWCMGPETVKTTFSSKEDTDRADDKFGFRIVVIIEKQQKN
ncbi:SUMF1/EgtB/PvdO family nonheme iron enzyme [bacterium AH-315-M05]|nr:SUMF1/EgtB/PvdO family nonheme iron enzyme [bacterium AH-315-M05]